MVHIPLYKVSISHFQTITACFPTTYIIIDEINLYFSFNLATLFVSRQLIKLEENEEKTPNYSFIQMVRTHNAMFSNSHYQFSVLQYRYTTLKDKLLIYLGLISALVTGSIQPCNSILFGDLTGTIIKYAQSLYSNDTEVKKKAEDDLIDGITYFAQMNTYIGIIMLVCSFISTVAFNYSAMRQVII